MDKNSEAYQRHKEKMRLARKVQALAGRDIGAIPDIVDPRRRSTTVENFRAFCDSYFPCIFSLPWSADHVKIISKIEQAVLRGGLFAMAMPRGSGKTTLCEVACTWAVLHGHREFVALIGSSEAHARELLESIKGELENNELLLEDFPEAVLPIQNLEGISHKCKGQLYGGNRTQIGWTTDEMVMPTLAPEKWVTPFVRANGLSLSSGATIQVAGITGRIRGLKHKKADGQSIRPTLVVLDDPQTDESARSPSQCVTRESILAGAILGLAGPGQKISGIMPCTVIRPGDMADSILNRDKHPEWNGERTKMVYTFPSNERLWEQYADIRADSLRQGHEGVEATTFYQQHREEMDAGATVAWPERFNHDELSAVQNAMNLRFQDEAAFWAEYQNEPLLLDARASDMLSEQIAERVNHIRRWQVPTQANRLTAFIDVQKKCLFYMVVAWADDFSGYIIDYGTYPDQKRAYFTLQEIKITLAMQAKGNGLEGSIFAGLKVLGEQILLRGWNRDDGAQLQIERCLIDASWGQSTAVVRQFCRESVFSAVAMPSHGRGVGVTSKPFSQWTKKPGERLGLEWIIPGAKGKSEVRHVLYDTNFWKSFVYARLSAAHGDKGSLTIYGDKPEIHRMLADHLTSEYRTEITGRGRIIDEWKLRPERPDNHWFDCLIGCAVAASIQGVELQAHGRRDPIERPRISFQEAQRKAKLQRVGGVK